MANNSETGHAKNVANFESLISFANGYGPAYNPSKPTLTLPALNAGLQEAKSSLEQINTILASYENAITARERAFTPLSKLMTRVMNTARSSDITPEMIDNIQSIIRKIQGTRVKPKLTEEEKAAQKAEGSETKEISSSQLSFDSRIENLDKLVKLLASLPGYAPNEEDVKTGTLQNLLTSLRTLNADVISIFTQLSNARLNRNVILYKPDTGVVVVAIAVKTYIKAVFGATSPQYKQVSGLNFRSNNE